MSVKVPELLVSAVCLGVAGLSLIGMLAGEVLLAGSRPTVQGDPRCYVAQTPLRAIQTRTIDEALSILRADLVDAEVGQSGMLIVKGCR